MPRGKKKEEDSGGMSKYLQKQNTEEVTRQNSDSDEAFMGDLKGFLKGEFNRVNLEFQIIWENFKDLDFRLIN